MSPQTIQAITSALTPLANKLGESASYLFELAVRQSYVQGIEDIFCIIVMCAIGIPYFLFAWKKLTFKKQEECSRPEWNEGIAWLLNGMVLIVFLIGFMCAGTDAINALANPQYYAVMSILHAIVPQPQ